MKTTRVLVIYAFGAIKPFFIIEGAANKLLNFQQFILELSKPHDTQFIYNSLIEGDFELIPGGTDLIETLLSEEATGKHFISAWYHPSTLEGIDELFI